MTDARRQFVERETTRYELRDGGRLSVVLTCSDVDGQLEGKAIDLSRGGTKVMLASPLPINAKVEIRLLSETESLDMNLPAHVCWALAAYTKQMWWVGLAFERDLNSEQFASFAKAGFIERRSDPRHVHDAAAKARWELDSKSVDVRILDLSAGGVKLLAPNKPKVGDRLMLEVDDGSESAVLAKVLWHKKGEGGYLVGCCFVNRHSYPQLTRALAGAPKTPLSRFRPRHLSVRAVVGLALGVATCALGAWLLSLRG